MTGARRMRGRTAMVIAVVAAFVVAGATAAAALAPTAGVDAPGEVAAGARTTQTGSVDAASPSAASVRRAGDVVPLAPLVAAWPDAYTATGTKAEPLYTERITATRSGTTFAVRIEAIGQGDAALGTQVSVVEATGGAVRWLEGCTKSHDACAADPALRGFLATAAIVSLAQRGALPDSGTVRTLHGASVVCIPDADLHPDAAAAIVDLDPCVDPATGAVLGHWSPDSDAFVGPTLAAGFAVTATTDTGLLPAA